MEYKSLEGALDIDAFYKAEAYASLYKSYGESVDEISADDVTVSLVREARPDGLFTYFREHGYVISNPYRGIYYIEGKVLFPTQIIVTGELDEVSHIWLGSLWERMEEERKEGIKEGIKRGGDGIVDTLRAFGHGDPEIKDAIMQRYVLSEEEAEGYLKEKR